jgi:hypothetical protein
MAIVPDLTGVVQAIPELHGRVQGVAALSALMTAGQVPQVTPAGFVLPLGLRGGSADAVTGMFRQQIAWTSGVVLVVRVAGDVTGAKANDILEPLIEAVILAIAGTDARGPDEAAIGVWRLSRGELLSLSAGVLIYQLDFAIDDQLRIAR